MTSPAPLPPVLEELKPCPFCGSTKLDDYFCRDGRQVLCGCGASVTRHHGPGGDTRAEVRAAWNTRAPDPALLEQVKEGERAKEALSALIRDLEEELTVDGAWVSDWLFVQRGTYRRAKYALSQPQEDSHG